MWVNNYTRRMQGNTKSRSANHTHESYPESYPRIIPPSQTSRAALLILRHTHIYICVCVCIYVMMQDLQVQIDMWELQARVLRIRFIEFLAELPRCHVPPWCRAAVAHLLCGGCALALGNHDGPKLGPLTMLLNLNPIINLPYTYHLVMVDRL